MLPVWKKNPQANYEGTVDTPKLFEFVEALRSTQDHWVFEFEEAQHIMETVRRQLAYLFMEGLILREKVRDLRLPSALRELSGKSLKLALERPLAWEYRLFSSVLADAMNADRNLKWDLQYGLKIARIHRLDDLPLMHNWIQQKLNDIEALVHSAGQLMNQAIQEALGKPGEPGDPEHVVYVARQLARVRKELVNWTIEFGCTKVQPECEKLLSLLSSASKDAIEKIESIPPKLDNEIAKALEANKRGEKYVAELMLKMEMSHSAEICAEFQRLSQLIN